MISDPNLRVNHEFAPNAIFPVNPECAEFLSKTPLPPELAAAYDAAVSIEPKTLVAIVIACAENSLGTVAARSAITAAAMLLHNDNPARCMACFTWSEEPFYAVDSNGSGQVATLCMGCSEKLGAGHITPTMQANLRGHGVGVAS